MLERIEKLQIAILGLLLAFGLIFAVKTGVSAVLKNSVTVTGSAYEIVHSDSGNIDVAIAGMNITDERKKVVVFSDPYYTSGLIVMVKKDDDTIKGFSDLEGKRIAVQIGTTGANKAGEVKNAKVTAFNDNTAAAMELKNGGADAVINDSPVLKYYLQQGGSADAKVVGAVMNSEDYGIAVKKGNDKLAAEINKALAEMKQNGEYDKLYKTWFGEEKK